MDLDFSEEQRILMKSARDFLAKESPKSFLRDLREDERGFPPQLWPRMVELGWPGVIIPEEFEGTGGSFMDLAILMETMGEACLTGPFFSTVVLGSTTILLAGSKQRKKDLLPRISRGELILALAQAEPGNWYGSDHISVHADEDGEDYVITGTKHFVENAHIADKIICVAQTGSPDTDNPELTLFLVDRNSPGVSIRPFKTLAYEKQCEVVFDSVRVGKDDMLGEPGKAGPILKAVEERAAVAKCAEMVGAIQSAFSMSVEYAKEREQFGRPIGSFQAIQHHLANMAVDVDSSRFITYQAAWKISEGLEAGTEAAMAKAFTSEAAARVTRYSHQIHGAVSFCDEHDLHFYYRKVKAASVAFGDTEYHLEHIARDLGL
ncbi:MAG: acyl-CoA/acyl-ACP dehydrogenase [Deltaproteobacteria bacterium]|nr:acyl-CoA/acyl-ACP dehydrogenase [Deltaproteobacteria bacterium]